MIMRAGPGLKFTFALSLNESFFGLAHSINTITGGGGGTITFKAVFSSTPGKGRAGEGESGVQNARCRPCRSPAM